MLTGHTHEFTRGLRNGVLYIEGGSISGKEAIMYTEITVDGL